MKHKTHNIIIKFCIYIFEIENPRITEQTVKYIIIIISVIFLLFERFFVTRTQENLFYILNREKERQVAYIFIGKCLQQQQTSDNFIL